MNKELTPLEALRNLTQIAYGSSDDIDDKIKNYFELIEKSLKALEIIKKKKVDVWFILISNSVEDYNLNSGCKYPLTQEQYDLLKEVLL